MGVFMVAAVALNYYIFEKLGLKNVKYFPAWSLLLKIHSLQNTCGYVHLNNVK